ncbi:cobalamin biosynthesis protein [Streptomyces candidus]|uniref:Cobalamin biosynthesis protein CbiG n=1 Tax=Streptomyces candidus TaxID=67283 RepID=A0A7X0HN44_9ACTN|nr:cobalamin biosynthesis protein [Streptomyces candidus]MBB6439208.1 cobalamin biosynthesis protein CbiG [Streptomyces candidus]
MDPLIRVVVGVGACEDAPVEELYELVTGALADAGLAPAGVTALATVDVKAGEGAIVECGRRLGVPVLSYGARVLAGVTVPNPSGRALSAVGTPSVAEAAALAALGPGRELLVPKRKSSPAGRPAMATCAVAVCADTER